jgi:predicted phage-related endonuclease
VFLRCSDRHLGATPDSINAAGEPVEIKCVARSVFDAEWDGEPPLHYQLQALTQAILLDAPRAWLAAFLVNDWRAELRTFELPRHPEAEERIVAKAAEFWARVARRDPPAAVYGRDSEALTALYPREEPGKVIDLSGDNLLPGMLDERATLKAEIKAAEARCGEIDDEIKSKLGDAETALLQGWKLTWKQQHRREVVIPAKSFRVLRIAERKDKVA